MSRRSKPWWNDEQQILQTEMSTNEKGELKSQSSSDKSYFKHIYTAKSKTFDEKRQQCKRKCCVKLQTELLNACDKSNNFWEKE